MPLFDRSKCHFPTTRWSAETGSYGAAVGEGDGDGEAEGAADPDGAAEPDGDAVGEGDGNGGQPVPPVASTS